MLRRPSLLLWRLPLLLLLFAILPPLRSATLLVRLQEAPCRTVRTRMRLRASSAL